MKTSRKYEDESEKLAKPIDIAISAYKKYIPFGLSQSQVDLVIEQYEQLKKKTLNPEPQFKRVASLKYLVEAALTPFQEGAGEAVEYFWKNISDAHLDYQRENKLEKILAQKKIKNRIDYEYVTDMLVIAEKEHLISQDQAERLAQMLASYENSHKNRRTT